jgi:hypothetical protein
LKEKANSTVGENDDEVETDDVDVEERLLVDRD